MGGFSTFLHDSTPPPRLMPSPSLLMQGDGGLGSQCARAEVRTPASCVANTAHGVSTPKRSTPGSVLDDFSLADTFIAQPPPHRLHLIKHSHGGHSATYAPEGGSCEYARVCCGCTIAILSYFPPPGAGPASPPIHASPPILISEGFASIAAHSTASS